MAASAPTFLFALDFAAPPPPAAVEKGPVIEARAEPPPITPADLLAAEEAAYRRGQADAGRALQAERNQILSRIELGLAGLPPAVEALALAEQERVARALLEAFRCALPGALDRAGRVEATWLLRRLRPILACGSEVEIRVAADVLDAAGAELGELLRDEALRISLRSDAGLRADEVRVRWARRGARRDRDDVLAAVANIFAGAGLAPTPEQAPEQAPEQTED